MTKINLEDLLTEWVLDNHRKAVSVEEEYLNLNEIKIDELNTYPYREVTYLEGLGKNKAWEFEDRCGNLLVVVYLETTGEFKSGYKVEGVSTLVFDPTRLPQKHPELGNLQEKIKPCPDDKRVNTVYKILVEEVIPKYLLTKKPNKLYFNPVSKSRERLVSMLVGKAIEQYPQLTRKNNYLLNY
jgi:hypothetical protein